ncbi:M23 family metallopeptidase [Amnibacterium endophyticum]|uniref:Peptidoglycan DD-metalloendopeptidase family protein n=1 Tax=Amnibacterium endophyticum TaxID=2109337 RepID=A0ABW4LHL9_9MICO
MGSHTRRAMIAAAAAGVVALVAVPVAAQADEYPTWAEVQRARKDVRLQAQEVARLKSLLAKSRELAEAAQREAQAKGATYQAARARVDAASERIDTIAKQVKRDRRRADEAMQRAGQLAAQLSRTGGTDPETSLLFSGGSDEGPSDFLAKLGRLSKLTESNGAIAADAQAAKNAAEATQAQLQEAKDQLVELRNQAKVALDAAVRASEAANAKVQAEEDKQVELQALLDALQAKSDSVAAGYQRGVAARKAALRAQTATKAVTTTGWALPASGPITGRFGPRPNQPAGANYFHRGTDIGAAYGSPIYAAHAGTVTYAGWFGTYGYWIEINNGDGISTGYAHIRPGGIFVRVGQQVTAGQNIASVGATGAATGPHLHFETRVNEVAQDAQPFMAARGITL